MIVVSELLVKELLLLLDDCSEQLYGQKGQSASSNKQISGLIGRIKSTKHELEETAKTVTADDGVRLMVVEEDEEDIITPTCVECGAALKTPPEWVASMCNECLG